LFKIIIKRGKIGQKIRCKIAIKKKRGGAKLYGWQKDRGKIAIKYKKVHLIRKEAKRWGAKL